jgi:tellurite resistance-related uncharacterized protein
LQSVDINRILLIRKISKLGLESADILEKHFSRFGTVDKVMVAHTHVKTVRLDPRGRHGQSHRVRPSALGFVVMSQPHEVQAIFAAGEQQVVQGVVVSVRQFERRSEKEEPEPESGPARNVDDLLYLTPQHGEEEEDDDDDEAVAAEEDCRAGGHEDDAITCF